jgi:Fic family protein
VPTFDFLQGLDADLNQSLLNQLRDRWTHSSTALEGNLLTLGETKFVIEEGLTVAGKPLKDHQSVVGHAKAIDLLYQAIANPITPDDLFLLHQAIQTEVVTDIYQPNGAWKKQHNGTYAINPQGQQVFIEFSAPDAVADLMQQWLQQLNYFYQKKQSLADCIHAYARLHLGFVHIHPFFDGNGRMARLLCNLVMLWSGYPPLVIDSQQRQAYLRLISDYQIRVGQLQAGSDIWPHPELLLPFNEFCQQAYEQTNALLIAARQQQAKRA